MRESQHTLILGLGTSGTAAAKLLLMQGARVTVLDAADSDAARECAAQLQGLGAKVFLGAQSLPEGDVDQCIVSPGIPDTSPWVIGIRECGVPVLSELELGWVNRSSEILAVTGSNGKSTVVKWLVDSLVHAGLMAEPAGNFGPPLSAAVQRRPPPDWLVTEVSSFQLETVDQFRPAVGVLLNCLPNHLNRHETMQNYLALKARMFRRTAGQDACIVPVELAEEVRTLSGGAGRWITFGAGRGDYAFREGMIHRPAGEPLSVAETPFDNEVLGAHAAAVIAALECVGIDPGHALEAARSFEGLPHRLQKVGAARGVRFINDSKATNLAALGAAVRMAGGPVRLIAGGQAKESDFVSVKEVLAEYAAGVYLMGQAADAMCTAWEAVVPVKRCDTLAGAFAAAARDAKRGDVVLLSPGCASFDQFKNFEERGEHFVRLAKEWVQEEAQ